MSFLYRNRMAGACRHVLCDRQPGVIFLAFVRAGSIPLQAATMEGTVRNGTTGRAAAGLTVHLIKLQQGMTPVANATTDAQGVFHIETDALGGMPGLIQVEYQGATYS